jgi:tRNA(Ile)-lysidine synthase
MPLLFCFGMIEDRLSEFLIRYKLTTQQTKMLVAFSGGIDSLCLLFLLHQLSVKFDYKLSAIHINHLWRGGESFEDERFARDFCEELGIQLFIDRFEEGLPISELLAREKRYEIFNKFATEHDYNTLMTAHTKTDQIETVLYRILKGTGYHGLCGIPEIRKQKRGPVIYRPLLQCSREEIEIYLKEKNLRPRHDSSNLDTAFLRNRIRHKLIPRLKEYNPQVEEAILRLSSIAYENEERTAYLMRPYYDKVFIDPKTIKTSEFIMLPDFLKPNILMKLLAENNIEYDYEMIIRLLNYIEEAELTHAGVKHSLVKNLFLHITQKNIKIVSPEQVAVVQSSVKVEIPGITEFKDLNVCLKVTEFNDQDTTKLHYPSSYADKAIVDLSRTGKDLELRSRQEGDFIQPFGMTGTMKLKKYLINHHIPQERKDFIPVIAKGSEVLWLAGVGLSDKIKVKSSPSHVFEIIRGNKESD